MNVLLNRESFDLMPPDIVYFEQRWLLAMSVSVLIAALMFDYSWSIVGVIPAMAINAVLFAISLVLMRLIRRNRSNVARWLMAIPFNLLILFYDVSHFGVMQSTGYIHYLAVLRLSLMTWATWALFTPQSRAWFAGLEIPDEE